MPASSQVTVRTGSGAVKVRGVTGGLVVETDTGAITCRLPAGLDADVAVRSLSGTVDVRLPLEVFGPDDPRILDGRIGRGGAPLIVRSRSGSIRLLEDGTADTGPPKQESVDRGYTGRSAGPRRARRNRRLPPEEDSGCGWNPAWST